METTGISCFSVFANCLLVKSAHPDIMSLGHCGTNAMPLEPRRWVIPDDPTVVPRHAAVKATFGQPNITRWYNANENNNTRLVFRAWGGMCTTSYAISHSGAQKAINYLGLRNVTKAIDNGISDLCHDAKYNFKCVSTWPSLFGPHRPAGSESKGSDIQKIGFSQKIRANAVSMYLTFSTRMNLDRLLRGETKFASQFAEHTGTDMGIDEISRATGHPEEVAIQEKWLNMTKEEMVKISWRGGHW